jgi:Ankyrin repeats (3 copies)/Ankyrin repeat
VQNNSLSLVRTVLGRDGTVDLLNKDDATPLLLAAAVGNQNIVEFLIEQGANVNHVAQRGDHAILQAAKAGHPHIVQVLVAKKADVNHTDEEGRSALHYAVGAGHVETVRTLLEHGAEPNTVDRHQCSPAHVAAQNSQQACLLLLIGKGAKLGEQSGDLLQRLMSSLQAETAGAAGLPPTASAAATPAPAATLPPPIAVDVQQKQAASLPPPLSSAPTAEGDDGIPENAAPSAPTTSTDAEAASTTMTATPAASTASGSATGVPSRKVGTLSAKPYIQEVGFVLFFVLFWGGLSVLLSLGVDLSLSLSCT